jgi:uncharacterized protein (DUF952 family)
MIEWESRRLLDILYDTCIIIHSDFLTDAGHTILQYQYQRQRREWLLQRTCYILVLERRPRDGAFSLAIMNSTEFPSFVYKISPTAPPDILPHALPLSELDAKDGFIHLSDAAQVPKTADLFFGTNRTLWFLKISTVAVHHEGFILKWANGLPGCVHLYGKKEGEQGRLGKGIVVGVKSFERKEESWATSTEELNAKKWLVDE